MSTAIVVCEKCRAAVQYTISPSQPLVHIQCWACQHLMTVMSPTVTPVVQQGRPPQRSPPHVGVGECPACHQAVPNLLRSSHDTYCPARRRALPEISNMSVSELKNELQLRNVDSSHCVEKGDLQALLFAAREEAPLPHAPPQQFHFQTQPSTPPTSNRPPPSSSSSSSSTAMTKKHTELYDRLGVAPDATQSEIKKAYYKMARLTHPDKHPGDADAAERFRLISEAYEILSDEQLRARYDKGGTEAAAPSNGFTDPSQLFNAFFGAGEFFDYIGDVLGGLEEGEDAQSSAAMRQQARRERIDRLREALIARLDALASEDALQREVEHLAQAPSGVELLHAIGYIYAQEATRAQGGLMGSFEGFRAAMHTISGVGGTLWAARNMQQQPKEQVTEEEAKNMLFRIGRIDIEQTLRTCCQEVLLDASLSEEQRAERAKALKRIGRAMKNATEPGS